MLYNLLSIEYVIMERGLRDGLVKPTINGLNAPFEQLYLDSWVIIPYFKWKINGGKEPQVIDYVKRILVKKVISDLVKTETSKKIKKELDKNITDDMWKECIDYLKLDCIGNPLNLSPTTPAQFDDAHLKTARTLHKCIILTGDKKLIMRDPKIVWSYKKLRQIHSNT